MCLMLPKDFQASSSTLPQLLCVVGADASQQSRRRKEGSEERGPWVCGILYDISEMQGRINKCCKMGEFCKGTREPQYRDPYMAMQGQAPCRTTLASFLLAGSKGSGPEAPHSPVHSLNGKAWIL